MTGARRWPLHPQPGNGEALTSWLARLAALYGLSVGQLLRHNLEIGSDLIDQATAVDLDWDPPLPLLEALAERTGVPLGQVRSTTLAGWVPWLADSLDARQGAAAFHTYARQDSVLLRLGDASVNDLGSWLPWVPADRSRRSVRRICPVCAEDPDRGILLTATVPLMLSCPEHGCYLEAEAEVAVASATGAGLRRAAPDDVRALDLLTGEGMANGTVTLPRRSVHVGVWFRMLRTLIDELSISVSRLRRSSADTVYQVWRTLDWPPRAGLTVWRPYERLDAGRRQALLHAAARALDLARAGQITASGTLGHLLTQAPHREVYQGERTEPPGDAHEVLRLSWEQATQDIEAWLDTARADPATARQILGILTHFARDRHEYYRERDFMIGFGVPTVFLPEPELGRFGPADTVR